MATRIKIYRSSSDSPVSREKSCQIAALGSRNVPICARIAHTHTHIWLSPRVSLHFAPTLSALRRGKEFEPRVLRANSMGFRAVSISQTNRGHLHGLAYQVARGNVLERTTTRLLEHNKKILRMSYRRSFIRIRFVRRSRASYFIRISFASN